MKKTENLHQKVIKKNWNEKLNSRDLLKQHSISVTFN